jgi:hypothetical protein
LWGAAPDRARAHLCRPPPAATRARTRPRLRNATRMSARSTVQLPSGRPTTPIGPVAPSHAVAAPSRARASTGRVPSEVRLARTALRPRRATRTTAPQTVLSEPSGAGAVVQAVVTAVLKHASASMRKQLLEAWRAHTPSRLGRVTFGSAQWIALKRTGVHGLHAVCRAMAAGNSVPEAWFANTRLVASNVISQRRRFVITLRAQYTAKPRLSARGPPAPNRAAPPARSRARAP